VPGTVQAILIVSKTFREKTTFIIVNAHVQGQAEACALRSGQGQRGTECVQKVPRPTSRQVIYAFLSVFSSLCFLSVHDARLFLLLGSHFTVDFFF
jgi:hypothetical protein